MRLKQFHLILIFPSFTSSRPGQFKLVDYTNYKTDLRTVFFKNGPSRPFLFIVGLCKNTIFQYVWCVWVGKLHHFRWWTVGAVNWLCRQAGRCLDVYGLKSMKDTWLSARLFSANSDPSFGSLGPEVEVKPDWRRRHLLLLSLNLKSKWLKVENFHLKDLRFTGVDILWSSSEQLFQSTNFAFHSSQCLNSKCTLNLFY